MDQVWQIIVGLFFVGTGGSIAVGILADHRSAKRNPEREKEAGINFADIVFALVFGGVGILVMFGLIGD